MSGLAPRATGAGGFGLVEAVVALALAAVAFGAVASATHTATRALRLGAARQAARTATADRLDAMRLAPPGAGSDVVAGAPPTARRWNRDAGRGQPDGLAAEAVADGTRVRLESAVWP